MVEIAATTKKSMAVPERRCMRRWSSGLRVVKLAKKSCTTKPPIHAQWKEGESVEEGAAVGARRPHQEFDPYQATVDQIADEDTETDNGKMEAEAVDCRRRHGLAPGTRPLSWVVDADDPALGPVLNGLCGNFGQRRLVA